MYSPILFVLHKVTDVSSHSIVGSWGWPALVLSLVGLIRVGSVITPALLLPFVELAKVEPFITPALLLLLVGLTRVESFINTLAWSHPSSSQSRHLSRRGRGTNGVGRGQIVSGLERHGWCRSKHARCRRRTVTAERLARGLTLQERDH